MALKTIVPPGLNIYTESYVANADLSALQYTVVAPVVKATGKYYVGSPSGQGVLTCGVLQNAPESGALASVRKLGTSQVIADSTFNAGVELTVAGTDGKVEAASSGDFVCGIAGEGAAEADQVVKMELTTVYQKN